MLPQGSSAFGQKPAFGGFGSTPSQSSPFGGTFQQTQSAFGSSTFGSASPFGAQSQPAFGATSTPAFGSTSTPAFGTTTTPAFGTTTPAFGSTTTPAFGSTTATAFGSTPNTVFGGTGTGFGASSTPAFGSTATSAFGPPSNSLFGSSSTSAFGASSTPAFGSASVPAFGSSSSPSFGFGSTPSFGQSNSTGMGFGASSTPAFGSTATSAFGPPSTSLFGSSSTSAFGASSTPAFGSASTPAFGSSSSPSFGFGTTPSFGQSNSTFGSTAFGASPSPFGSQSNPFGAQTAAPAPSNPGFGQSASFGGQPGGTRVAAYSPTPEADGGTSTQAAGKLESISAMPVYKDKSHEELRWEDYQRGDKGGPNPSGQPAGGTSFPAGNQSNPFGSTSTFGQPASNPFSSSTTSSNLFSSKTPAFGSSGFGSTSTPAFSSPFSSSSSSPFGSSTTAPAFSATSSSGFGLNTAPSLFGGASTSAPSSSFGSSSAFGNTQSSGLFQSTTPPIGQTSSLFGQPSTGFQQNNAGFGSNPFSTPSTGFGGGLFSNSTPSMPPTNNPVGFGQTTPSLSTPFQTAAAPQTSNAFGFGTSSQMQPQTSSAFGFGSFGQIQPASSGGIGNMHNMFGQSSFGQAAATQSNIVLQPATVTNPFGTLPVVPQMSIGYVGSAPSVQYGISSMPVSEKPNPVRISSLLTPRHLSQRRMRLPARRYHPKSDSQRVPFFTDDDGAQATPKADALFIPRENPRALVIRPIEQWPSRGSGEKQPMHKDNHLANANGKASGEPSAPPINGTFSRQYDGSAENGHRREYTNTPSQMEHTQKLNGAHVDHTRKGETSTIHDNSGDIEGLMPKLHQTDYYTEPKIQELGAKERAEPGFCRLVKDFVIGRHGYGSIKFFGETDVTRLDLESTVEFNNREVIVYKDENKKPPVGQGLNKPAEVTLLNIKCMNKKTGHQYTEGPKVEKYKEMLMKKAGEQGAEFVSYNPVLGEWKFKVKHFSIYGFGDEGADVTDCVEFRGRRVQDLQ